MFIVVGLNAKWNSVCICPKSFGQKHTKNSSLMKYSKSLDHMCADDVTASA